VPLSPAFAMSFGRGCENACEHTPAEGIHRPARVRPLFHRDFHCVEADPTRSPGEPASYLGGTPEGFYCVGDPRTGALRPPAQATDPAYDRPPQCTHSTCRQDGSDVGSGQIAGANPSKYSLQFTRLFSISGMTSGTRNLGIQKYGTIFAEDLPIRGLSQGMLAKSVQDASWSSFLNKLSYKAEHAGRRFVQVNPRAQVKDVHAAQIIPRNFRIENMSALNAVW